MVKNISALIESISADFNNSVSSIDGNSVGNAYIDVLISSLIVFNPKYEYESSLAPSLGKFSMIDINGNITNNYTDTVNLIFHKSDLSGYNISHFEYVDEAIMYLYDYTGFKATFLIDSVSVSSGNLIFSIVNKFVSQENKIAFSGSDIQIDVKILNGSI